MSRSKSGKKVVVSRNHFASQEQIDIMRKLTKRKILWILRWKNRMSTKDIALFQKVTPRRIQQLCREYRNKGQIILKRPGRPVKPIPIDNIKLILIEHPKNSCARIMERKILAKHNIHIPHNTIHMVLKQAGYAKDDPKKQKRRKWVRFEREHSLSLVHTDWHESKAIPGKQVIAYLDDASRMILAMDEWDNASTENAVKTLKKAMQFANQYTGIKQILTDNGSQFQVEFDGVLKKCRIEHVLSRVNHPQTNGKIERFYQTYGNKRLRFRTLDEFVNWYNRERMHMSLNMRHAETPWEAFIKKMEKGLWIGFVKEWFE